MKSATVLLIEKENWEKSVSLTESDLKEERRTGKDERGKKGNLFWHFADSESEAFWLNVWK